MARPRDLRLWGLAVCAFGLLAAGTGLAGGVAAPPPGGQPEPPVALMSATVDAAVLPGRLVDEVRSAGAATPSRALVVGAVLGIVFGAPGLLRRTTPAAGGRGGPLATCRYTIALRAPPLRSA